MLRCLLLLTLVFPTLSTSAFANDEVWRGLIFDKSTVETAIDTIGKPKRNRFEKLKTLSTVNGKVDVRTIEYEKIDGWEKVSLSFLNHKLFRAKFWPRNKTMPGFELANYYKADFLFVEGFSKKVSLSVFDGQKEPTVPKVYPTVYFMVAAKPDRHIIASINNSSFGSFWKQIGREPTVRMFPGFVEDIEILSRTGENK